MADTGACESEVSRGKTRLAFTWEWKGDAPMQFGVTDVLIEPKEPGDSVEFTLAHSGFPNEEVTCMHQGGWDDGCDKDLAA